MNCNQCRGEIGKDHPIYCHICWIQRMWELDKLESIKKIIDQIIERSKLEGRNPYNKNDWEHLF